MPRQTKAQRQQVRAVKDRLLDAMDPARTAAREGVRLEAEDAGLDEDTVAAVVDSAMSAWEDLRDNEEAWEDLVASVIQGHAAP